MERGERTPPRWGRREALRGLLSAGVMSAAPWFAGCDAVVSGRIPGIGADPASRWRRAVDHVEGELRGPSVHRAHRWLREAASLDPWRRTSEEHLEVLVVGGGVAGLSAARGLLRAGVERFVVLELEAREGGTSTWGERGTAPHPWGAHYLPLPLASHGALVDWLGELGLLEGRDEHGDPLPAEEAAVREPEERLFLHGVWYAGTYPYAGASRLDLAELRRFQDEVHRWVAWRDAAGRRAFALPSRASSEDPLVVDLDRISAEAWLRREGFRSVRLRWLCEYACRDDYGLSIRQCSAWALLFYWAARIRAPGEPPRPLLAWPEGNGRLVQALARPLGPRLRRDVIAVRIRPLPEGRGVEALAWDIRADRPLRLLARRAILATPHFVARRLLADRWDARRPQGPSYASWLVANVHLSRRPEAPGVPLAWDNVLYDSPSVGYVDATHQQGRDHGPTIWTYYLPLVEAPPGAIRQSLLQLDWESARDLVLQDLARAHYDLLPRVERIDVFRWGHAMPQPRPGQRSPHRLAARARPLGPVHFAHSDLSCLGLFEEAFDHGLRAADEIAAVLRPPPATIRSPGAGRATPPPGDAS